MIIYIPAPLMAILTFPGIIIHEMAHRFFCDIFGVPVYKVCYFQIGNPAGFVLHGEISSPNKRFLISFGPVVFNIILGVLLCFPAIVTMFYVGLVPEISVYFLMLLLGLSIGMHGIPSKVDMECLKSGKKGKVSFLLRIIFFPFYFFAIISNFVKNAFLDLFFAALIGFILPAIVINSLPSYKPQSSTIDRSTILTKMEKRIEAQKELDQYYGNIKSCSS